MNKRKLVGVGAIVVVLLAAVVAFLFWQSPSIDERSSKITVTPRVAILTMGPFPLLDMILAELKIVLESNQDPEVAVTVLNANFQQELLRKSAREMASGTYDVLVPLSTPATQMVVAENAGRKPVVFAFVSTPSEIGLKEPGSLPNVTGFIDTVPLRENLDLVERISGKNAAIGYLVNDGEAPSRTTYEQMLKEATKRGIRIKKIPISNQSDIRPSIFPVIDQVDCLFFGPDSVASGAADLIVQLAAEKGKPVFCTDRISVGRGCLGCVAPDYAGLGKRTAQYVLRILRGESPHNLPVVDFEEYITYINPYIGDKLHIQVPEDILHSATVIKQEAEKTK